MYLHIDEREWISIETVVLEDIDQIEGVGLKIFFQITINNVTHSKSLPDKAKLYHPAPFSQTKVGGVGFSAFYRRTQYHLQAVRGVLRITYLAHGAIPRTSDWRISISASNFHFHFLFPVSIALSFPAF